MIIKKDKTGNSYSQSVGLASFQRLFYISGQVPETESGELPQDFRGQCLLAWENVARQLSKSIMNFSNLIKVTIFLSDRSYREQNKIIRKEVLGHHSPALTIIVVGIHDQRWLLETEVVAAE